MRCIHARRQIPRVRVQCATDEDISICFIETCYLKTDFYGAYMSHLPKLVIWLAKPGIDCPLAASQRLLWTDCGLERSIATFDPEHATAGIVTYVVQTLFFVPRVVTRLIGLSPWGRDDTSCVVASVSPIIRNWPHLDTQSNKRKQVLLIPYLVLSILCE